jgi:hypothetical protein
VPVEDFLVLGFLSREGALHGAPALAAEDRIERDRVVLLQAPAAFGLRRRARGTRERKPRLRSVQRRRPNTERRIAPG